MSAVTPGVEGVGAMVPPLPDLDLHLFREGTLRRMADCFGAVLVTGDAADGHHGAHFAVWAPNARSVSVVGDWNGWDHGADPMVPGSARRVEAVVRRGRPGHTSTSIAGTHRRHEGSRRPTRWRSAARSRRGPARWSGTSTTRGATTAGWTRRRRNDAARAPMTVYEVHSGSWRRDRLTTRAGSSATARSPRCWSSTSAALGFTHVELLPVMEHPFYGSWGYQATGLLRPHPPLRHPSGLMALVDTLHQAASA